MSKGTEFTNDPMSPVGWAELRADLRDFALRHLPQAAVPSNFVILPDLPKLASGKVDRKKLPKAWRDNSADNLQHSPPQSPHEKLVATIWTDLLNVGRVGLEDNFFELGGNSLIAAQLAARVRADAGVVVQLRQFFERPTVARMAELIAGKRQAAPVAAQQALGVSPDELLVEARLPDDIAPDALPRAANVPPYSEIFVTGGSGSTGAFLVRELLARSEAHLFVLIRADDEEHARQRIKTVMERFGTWRDDIPRRVTLVIGDLARPYFGLDRATYTRLVNRAQLVVHNGALSSYAMSYRTLKAVNVLGTQEVLRFACRGRLKPVHYVSSLGIYPNAPVSSWPEDELTDPTGVTGGYVQTKWVGDSMVLQAGRRGLPVCVYRPGLITGAQDTGAVETDTFINAMIKGSVQLGAFPVSNGNQAMEIVPVDFCAAAIAHTALAGKDFGKVFNVVGARPMKGPELIDCLEAFGYRLRRLPFSEWLRELSVAVEAGKENELSRFLTALDEFRHQADQETPQPSYQTTNLKLALRDSDVRCAQPDRALWDRYLRWFVASGYLPPPSVNMPSARAKQSARAPSSSKTLE